MKREEIDALVEHTRKWHKNDSPGTVTNRLLSALEEFTSWRPMGTAPRDGTRILVRVKHAAQFDPGGDVWVKEARWNGRNGWAWPYDDQTEVCCLGWLPIAPALKECREETQA